jgi:hypothetical protein
MKLQPNLLDLVDLDCNTSLHPQNTYMPSFLSCPHMYKSCPPLRGCTILPQRSDSIVQRMGNSVYIEYLNLEESFVEALSYERSIRIVHCPVELSARHKTGMRLNSPHGSYHALETHK